MDGHQIVLFLVFILISTLISKKIQDKVGIPLPLTLLGISAISTLFIHIANVDFSILMMILLPLLLVTDALGLSLNELQKKYKSVVYIAFIAVIFSVAVGTYTMTFLSSLPFLFFLTVFSIIMATDAVSVSAVFSKFEQVPHSVKFFAESESLFNDATAVIIFTLVTIPLINGLQPSFFDVGVGALKVIVLSTLIGVVSGIFFSYLMSFFDDTLDEFLFIPLTAYVAFYVAEMFHVSGILAVVSSILIFKDIVIKNINHFVENAKGSWNTRMMTTYVRLSDNEKLISQLAFLATAVLFVSLGSVIEFHEIVENFELILIVFGVTTVIRYSTFIPMILTKTIKTKDSVILALGGIKGGLAVLLVHMIPANYEYKHLIEVVIFGQILLSTFVYVPLMMYFIPKFYKEDSHD